MTHYDNRRILLIDDNPEIHEDFKKILLPAAAPDSGLQDMRSAFLGAPDEATEATAPSSTPTFEIASAFQGEEGYKMVCQACDQAEPYAMAFVDMRMPPGWDGVETIAKLWERDPDLHVVICTAFSDYTWDETIERLGQSDKLLILKKPFDAIEITMLASALTAKWNLTMSERELFDEAKRSEQEARAYASSLETVNRALVTSKAASDMALELRTEFLVQISNEVNTRLCEVLGNVESLTDFVEGSERSRELELALDISQHLLKTIDEVLDVTALERGKCSLEEQRCSPVQLANEVAAGFAERAEKKGVTLEVVTDGELPAEIETEPQRVGQILENLIENALKCTASGSVQVVLRNGQASDWHRPKFEFEVIDTGPGIPAERMGSIFEPFARCSDDAQNRGFGFGLALARRLALLLGGDITARSEEGRGSAFKLTLQLSHSRSTAEAA